MTERRERWRNARVGLGVGLDTQRLAGSLLWSKPRERMHRRRPNLTDNEESVMITEAIVAAPPVLAAGWSLLYLLFGGGLGGALLIFFGLKLIGR